MNDQNIQNRRSQMEYGTAGRTGSFTASPRTGSSSSASGRTRRSSSEREPRFSAAEKSSRFTSERESVTRSSSQERTARFSSQERNTRSFRETQPPKKENIPNLLYDARGVRVKKSKFSGSFVRTLLFFVLPYLLINSLIFILVTATPKIEVKIADTDNYVTTEAKFTVNALLPVKELSVSMESEPVEYVKNGSGYTATLNKNGTFYVEATLINGMRSVGYADVSILDDAPPVIDSLSCKLTEGVLSFLISDSQSGVDWNSIYAVTADQEKIVPSSVNKETGLVEIPIHSDSAEIVFSDMVGNSRSATFTATTNQLTE